MRETSAARDLGSGSTASKSYSLAGFRNIASRDEGKPQHVIIVVNNKFARSIAEFIHCPRALLGTSFVLSLFL